MPLEALAIILKEVGMHLGHVMLEAVETKQGEEKNAKKPSGFNCAET